LPPPNNLVNCHHDPRMEHPRSGKPHGDWKWGYPNVGHFNREYIHKWIWAHTPFGTHHTLW
jgi:hypothetical protein